jgi:hypothetical protein
LFLTTAIILLLSGCSTRKNTFPNRAYHTVTSKFNVNFNAKEALKEGEATLTTKTKDNFTTLLPIYNYPAKADLSSIMPQMDRAITKASKSIYKHSMMIRGVEHVRTMDDIYLIMAKAYFYKQEYAQARRILAYIENTYKGPKWNCRPEAMILAARTALRQGYYTDALGQLDAMQYEIFENGKRKMKMLYNTAYAEYHLTAPNGEIPEAINYIQGAIENHPPKAFKTRLYFILGQLYEKTDQKADAQKYFKKVITRTPPYDMEFAAYMHLATNYDGTTASKFAIMKNLNKMLGELKNESYRDQIYYAMAKMAAVDEDTIEQKKYLKKSVAAYMDNNYQRSFSAIQLADILFNEDAYLDAQSYYDTALMTLPNDYPNKEAVVKKGSILRELTDNLKMIMLQDSLQRIAKLPEAKRRQWVQKMIADYTENERKMAEEEANRMAALANTVGMANINTTQSNGKWYFYNQQLITQGKTEFFRLWGNRKLEDNWRISNKQQLSFEELAAKNNPKAEQDSIEYDEDGNPIKKREIDPKQPEFYLQDLPLTQQAMDSSNKLIVNALFQAAIIYADLLNDIPRSNESFAKLISRFPKDTLVPPSLYMQYCNYLRIKDATKAEVPKNTLLTQYPETDYAKLILDPDYYKKLQAQEDIFVKKYEEAYLAFQQKNWNTVIGIANEALSKITDPELCSKYAYLRAIAIGQTVGTDSLIQGMKNILIHYTDQKVAELAKIHLADYQDFIQKGMSLTESTDKAKSEQSGTINANSNPVASPFISTPNEMHYIVFIADAEKVSIQDLKLKISQFNKELYSIKNFNINSFYINQTEQMINISRFADKKEAMDYYNIISKDHRFLTMIIKNEITIFAMSAKNYSNYYNNK